MLGMTSAPHIMPVLRSTEYGVPIDGLVDPVRTPWEGWREEEW